jgi:glutamate-1-semialdehyde aminotransferase
MLDAGVYLPPSMMEVEFLSTAHDDDSLRMFTETFDDFVRGGAR